MTVEEWLALDTTESKSKKGYAHFDVRTSMRMKKEYILELYLNTIFLGQNILTDASTSTIVFFWGSDTIVG